MRSWTELPVGRVVRLDGADAEAVALAIDPLPEDAPAIVTYTATEERSTTSLVDAVLNELEAAAAALFPAWLPGAEGISGPGGVSVPAVRTLARRKAAGGADFGPFLAGLAERALTGRPSVFPPEIRAAGLARVLAAGFGRSHTSLLVRVPEGLTDAAQEVLAAGCEWLAHRGGFGVWLVGTELSAVDRVARVPFPLRRALPEDLATRTPSMPTAGACPPRGFPAATEAFPGNRAVAPRTEGGGEVPRAGISYPAVAGRPHPASPSERALEAALISCGWAAGRGWNQTLRLHPLSSPVRVDLLWQAERCVVEVDGPDHRGELKFAEDRSRDVRLQLAGYSVLRFTDSQVLTDTQGVVRQIELFLQDRRRVTQEG
ncbi:endonuclease domain-containing protein [Nonomuraea sp. NPDC049714]|uniref:endonuclease domain-containing protein n=1 Tax=Nonomuraea sp. NPDC049714 TaxID=3364357 RepID=UPI003787A0B4